MGGEGVPEGAGANVGAGAKAGVGPSNLAGGVAILFSEGVNI